MPRWQTYCLSPFPTKIIGSSSLSYSIPKEQSTHHSPQVFRTKIRYCRLNHRSWLNIFHSLNFQFRRWASVVENKRWFSEYGGGDERPWFCGHHRWDFNWKRKDITMPRWIGLISCYWFWNWCRTLTHYVSFSSCLSFFPSSIINIIE